MHFTLSLMPVYIKNILKNSWHKHRCVQFRMGNDEGKDCCRYSPSSDYLQSLSSIASDSEMLLPAHSQSNFYMHVLIVSCFPLYCHCLQAYLPTKLWAPWGWCLSYSSYCFQNFLWNSVHRYSNVWG